MVKDFLPISKKDMKKRGWEQCDFVYVIGDAYVDHSSFGPAIISRLLEAFGYKVGIIAQPDWKDKNSIAVLGAPRLGFLVSAGNMDSMVNHYTVSKKHRKTDSFSPGGVMGRRPDYATVVYCNLIRQTFKKEPIIIGFTHAGKTDYWILKEHVLPRLSPVEALHMPGLHQISLAYAEPGESAAWSEAFTEGCGENAGVHFSNICIDITAPDVSKAAGMTHLLELRRWGEAKEVLVIGDDMNDLPMIRHFNGHAVANAAPEVRDAASSVFLSVGQMLRERV